jgi:hypothetical protein
MVFKIEELKHYLSKQKTLEEAINEISEQAIIDSLPIDNFESLNYQRNKENLPKYEAFIGMSRLIEEQKTICRNTNGVKGRQWLALSPKWLTIKIPDTRYEIQYWVNYGDGDTYGWFTVEQIKQWFQNPEIKLHQLGGTKER